MARIIVIKPNDCPFREMVGGNYYCEHPSMTQRYCTWTNYTPANCPMTKKDLRSIKLNKILKK